MTEWILILILATPFGTSITNVSMFNEHACKTAGQKYIEFIKYNTSYVCIRRD
jgi:hypothetical protein